MRVPLLLDQIYAVLHVAQEHEKQNEAERGSSAIAGRATGLADFGKPPELPNKQHDQCRRMIASNAEPWPTSHSLLRPQIPIVPRNLKEKEHVVLLRAETDVVNNKRALAIC